jgi:hypothetical protein
MRDGRYVTNHNLASTSGSWRINGVGDFDEDGDADVLWRHSDGGGGHLGDGRRGVRHEPQHRLSAHLLADGVGDFDGDGDGDILWRYGDGATVTWEMHDGEYLVNHNLGVVSPHWRATRADDFDDDGDADILWRHRDGDIVTWEMEAGALVTSHNLGIVPAGWQIATGETFAI